MGIVKLQVSSSDTIEKFVKRIQNESLHFGCASALYGLTKMIHDAEMKRFLNDHSEKAKELQEQCRKAVESNDTALLNTILKKIDSLKDKDIALKFFYVNFYDMPEKYDPKEVKSHGVIDQPSLSLDRTESGSWAHVVLISLPIGIMSDITATSNEWTKDRIAAKNEQRRLIAHEIAHALFGEFAPELDTDENADFFAEELLELREYEQKARLMSVRLIS